MDEVLQAFAYPPDDSQANTLNDPGDGVIRTGLNAPGCRLGAATDKAFLLILTLFSVATLGWRRLKRKGWVLS